jgi:glycosyltransferase involved in cell wall biosynthesis
MIPTVSIVIPCYNTGRYVEEAVASARAQTCRDREIIVVDDGSENASTRDVLSRIASTSTDVTMLRIPHGGVSGARNAGIRAARGRYILPLDADDWIDPAYIEKTVPAAEANPDVGIVYTDVMLFGTVSGRWALPPYAFPGILIGNMIPSAALFRREDWEAVNGYNLNMEGMEDYDFWLSLIERGRQVVRIPEPLLHYRRRPDSQGARHTRQAIIRIYARLMRNHQRLYVDHIETVVEHILDLRLRVQSARYEDVITNERSAASA